MAADFFLGESLVGDGNEVAHIDLIIGSKSGPAGTAFCNALTNNKDGFTTLLAVVTPNLPAKPDTLMFNKVTIKGAKQAVQMFGPAQAAVARAVVDSVEAGIIPKNKADDYCIMVGVFIHWDAADDQKIYDYNYQAVRESRQRAQAGEPTVNDKKANPRTATHPIANNTQATRNTNAAQSKWLARTSEHSSLGSWVREHPAPSALVCERSFCTSTRPLRRACSIASSPTTPVPMRY